MILQLLSSANACEGMTRAEGVRLANVERQVLHDAFSASIRGNLTACTPPSVQPKQLTSGERAALKAHILCDPEPEPDGVSAWRQVDLCEPVERISAVGYRPWGLSRVDTGVKSVLSQNVWCREPRRHREPDPVKGRIWPVHISAV
jgi:hypothetical protein